ncbi:MAG: zf-HC2 domain-containing protein [Planctomycetes bacterium]|nr:zf-HC2 domain-containing protein [Planctomycetota bacterium]
MDEAPTHEPSSQEPCNDPCLQIQADLSAMLDGELDAPSVRRVLVHSDACAGCRAFLDGIRLQVRLHRDAERIEREAATSPRAARLREQLTENRRRLARIFYEIGRGMVLMGLEPEFSREVAKEPVPVPDMAQRGRNLLDEVARLDGATASQWVQASELLDGRLRNPAEALAKGSRLLHESLLLEPDTHEARIYLGLVHHLHGDRVAARREFTTVLACSDDRTMRGYATLSLGTLHLDEGDFDSAALLLRQVVDSGVVAEQPRLAMAFFNLALAHGMKADFGASLQWFRRLHDEFPHRRRGVRDQILRRPQFLMLLRNHATARNEFVAALPDWFPPQDLGAQAPQATGS